MTSNFGLPIYVDAIWLFGSFARKRPEAASDVDLLVLTQNENCPPDPCLLRKIFDLPKDPDISHYTRNGIAAIMRPPSLFAWHLRREGVALFERTDWLRRALNALHSYDFHLRDLEILRELLRGAALSLTKDHRSLVFDAGVLSLVARNAGLLLTDYDGSPDFSADAPLLAVHHPTVPLAINGADHRLLKWSRMAMERGSAPPELDRDLLMGLADALQQWLDSLRRYFGGPRNV